MLRSRPISERRTGYHEKEASQYEGSAGHRLEHVAFDEAEPQEVETDHDHCGGEETGQDVADYKVYHGGFCITMVAAQVMGAPLRWSLRSSRGLPRRFAPGNDRLCNGPLMTGCATVP